MVLFIGSDCASRRECWRVRGEIFIPLLVESAGNKNVVKGRFLLFQSKANPLYFTAALASFYLFLESFKKWQGHGRPVTNWCKNGCYQRPTSAQVISNFPPSNSFISVAPAPHPTARRY
jgi:hypothetical protein